MPLPSFTSRSASFLNLISGKKADENLLFIDQGIQSNPGTSIVQNDIYNDDIETIYNFTF
jgi:hypothetical protein